MQEPSSSVAGLAKILGMTEMGLKIFATKAPRLYRTIREPKGDGRYRIINPPHKDLKAIQEMILRKILNPIPIHQMLHSGPNTSTKTAAKKHIGQPIVIRLDIQDFFPTVSSKIIRRTLEAHGFPHDVAHLLTRLMSCNSRLPQGAPTSPAVARLVLRDVCKEIDGLLHSISPHARATIYVDDIIISGPLGLKRLIPTVISIFRRHGYTIKAEKTKPMTQNQEQVVLGLRVNRRIKPCSDFEMTLDYERKTLHPKDPRLMGLESYKRYIES